MIKMKYNLESSVCSSGAHSISFMEERVKQMISQMEGKDKIKGHEE